MLASRARWQLADSQPQQEQALASELGVSDFLAKLLIVRGMHAASVARDFLGGSEQGFHDPYLLKGMSEAAARIRAAVREGERILIYGDYDADGVSSTALMSSLLHELGADYDCYIPDRAGEGYGLNKPAIDQACANGVKLIVTVDNGISAVDQIAYASQLGLDVIVTDHHEPPQVLPQALAIINPKQEGCTYPFKGLCGAGVALKLAQALTGQMHDRWLQLATLGTVADLMPLKGENRYIVKQGLAAMSRSPITGIRALLHAAGAKDKDITSTHIGFVIGPRLNASGRLASANPALRLLVSSNEDEALHLAHELDELNSQRIALVNGITEEAKAMKQEMDGANRLDCIVLAKEGWHIGVVGIVASQLVDMYYRPVIILSIDPATGLAKGSARSIEGFDMYQALTGCKEWLVQYGGHQAAAGMTLRIEHIDAFARAMNHAAMNLSEEQKKPFIQVDMMCDLADVNLSMLEEVQKLEPFGVGNPAPRFLFRKLIPSEIRRLGSDGQHLKMTFNPAASKLEALAFGQGCWADELSLTSPLDLVGEVALNEWNGLRKPQLLIKDVRVNRQQVFDWRGSRPTGDSWRAWTLRLGSSDRTGQAGILDFGNGTNTALRQWARKNGLPLWQADGASTSRLEMPDAPDHYRSWKEILLTGLPHDLDELMQVMAEAESAERIYACFTCEQDSEFSIPDRDGFKRIYVSLLRQSAWEGNIEWLCKRFGERSGLSASAVRFIIEVFQELGIVQMHDNRIVRCPNPSKADLTSSNRYQAQVSRASVIEKLIYSSSMQLTQQLLAFTEDAEASIEQTEEAI